MKIALISCTKQKREYKCPARELYSESAWFREAYCYAKIVADKIFILSAKYGLVPEKSYCQLLWMKRSTFLQVRQLLHQPVLHP